jgi:WD40 repeat protein
MSSQCDSEFVRLVEEPIVTAAKTFDVFLSHNSKDKPAVERIAQKLMREGLEPWLDKWALTPGGQWQGELAAGIQVSSACAVFVGPHGFGAWENEELGVALDRAAKDRSFRLFLVLLPGLPEPFDANTLPPFLSTRTWIDLRGGIESTRPFQLLINAIKGVAPGPDSQIEKRDDVCPYRGLLTFDEEHAGFFFGRDADVQRLIEKLKATRFLAVIGASGSGKSSVVRAGLIPALRQGALPESHTWAIRVLTPGAHPLTSLAAQLLRLYPQDAMQKTLDQMMDDARSLHLAVSLAMAERPAGERVMWVIDQFEEVFTLCRDEREREQFFSNLLYAASIPDGRNMVLVTMRADFYQKCAAYADLSARIAAHQTLVSPMEQDGLRKAIEEPAWRVGLEFEQGLVTTILEDLANQPGALPLLEHALLELWERRRGRMLTLEAYRESGGVDGAIAARADAIWESLGEGEQAIVRRIMLRLTQPGEGTEDTRRHAGMRELITGTGEGDAVESVVRTLADARLLMTGTDEQSGDEVVDVSHEALIRGWPRLRRWIDEDRVGLRVHRRLTEAAQEWLRTNRDEGLLYRGARLAQTVEWRDRNESSMNESERDFLNASIDLQSSERRAAQRRTRRTVAGLTIALVLISLLGVVAIRQYLRAARERDESQSRELAASALSELPLDPELALLLSMEAASLSPTAQAEDALIQCLAESRVQAVMRGHSGGLNRARFSIDGNNVITSGSDGAVRIWETMTGNSLIEMSGAKDQIIEAAMSPDGKFIMSADKKGAQRLWDWNTGKEVESFKGPYSNYCFSPDGRLVLAFGDNGEWNLVEPVSGKVISSLAADSTFKGTDAQVRTAFSPEGTLIVLDNNNKTQIFETSTGRALSSMQEALVPSLRSPFSPDGKFIVLEEYRDHTLGVWDTKTGKKINRLAGHNEAINTVDFSPDGKFIVTSSSDQTAIVWALNSGQQVSTLSGHTGEVHSAAFSADSRYVVTASDDRTARVWEAETGNLINVLRGHQDDVQTAFFSPDGSLVITASLDNTARVWSVGQEENLTKLSGHTDMLTSIAISDEGGMAATASLDGTARIWNTKDWQLIKELRGHQKAIQDAEISPDGKLMVTASDDETVRVWDVSTGQELYQLSRSTDNDKAAKVRFSPDGKLIAVYGLNREVEILAAGTGQVQAKINGDLDSDCQLSPDNRFVLIGNYRHNSESDFRIWDTTAGQAVELPEDTKNLTGAAFSPTGKLVATGDYPGVTRIFELDTQKLVRELEGPKHFVTAIAFSPDGKLLAVATEDNSVRIWSVETGDELTNLRGHTSQILNVRFSRDGKFIFTECWDNTARIWQSGRGLSLAQVQKNSKSTGLSIFAPSYDGKFIISQAGNFAQIHPCELCGSIGELIALGRSRTTRQLTPEERKKYLHK